MSIKDILQKIKPYDVREDIFIVLTIILIGLAGFGLGKLSVLEKGRELVAIKPVTPAITESSSPVVGKDPQGLVLASKNGTKYYFSWCSGASRITEANKIWFNSYAEAQKAGFTPAANCSGLK